MLWVCDLVEKFFLGKVFLNFCYYGLKGYEYDVYGCFEILVVGWFYCYWCFVLLYVCLGWYGKIYCGWWLFLVC